jgi:RimJ/RimL family protein N-acetyltransferase
MKTLETERLILRPLVLEDHIAIQKYFPHWEIVKYLNIVVPWPYPDNGAYEFLSKIALPAMASGNDFLWGIISKEETEEVIGVIHLRSKPTADGSRGFWLAQEFQGRGYMTEAVAAVNHHAFADLGFETIIIKNAKGNAGSRRVKEKTGAKLLRTEPTTSYIGGFKESEVWELTKAGWDAFKA